MGRANDYTLIGARYVLHLLEDFAIVDKESRDRCDAKVKSLTTVIRGYRTGVPLFLTNDFEIIGDIMTEK